MTQHYIQAFKQFSKANDSDFKYIPESWGVYVEWEEKTYVVRTYADILKQHREFFDKPSYNELYTEINPRLWDILMTDELDVDYSDFMISMYGNWQSFWEHQRAEIKGGEARYGSFKRRAWEDLQILIQLTRDDITKIVKCAEGINGLELRPLIALSVRDQYEDFDDFINDVVGNLIDYGADLLAMEGLFESEEVNTGGSEPEVFYIYNDTLDYAFLTDEEHSVR